MLNTALSFDFILVLITIVINAVLIFLVYRQNKNNATNKLFVLLCLLMSLWLISVFLDTHFGPSVYLARLSIFIAAPLSLAFFLFAYVFPERHLSLRAQISEWAIWSTVAVMFVNISPYAFTGPKVVNDKLSVVPGLGFIPFAFLSTFFSVGAVYILIKKYKKSGGLTRHQLRLILCAVFILLGLVTATVLVPIILFQTTSFLPFISVYILAFLVVTAFTILKYHLFDVKVIATSAAVIILVGFLFFEGLLSGSLVELTYKLIFSIIIAFIGVVLVKSVHREIAQRKELASLAASLEKANARLKELDQLKTEFMSIASHQLRTPLSIIKGYTSLLDEGAYGAVTLKAKEVLRNIDTSNEHLIKLVDEFLNVSRIEQGRVQFSFAEMSMEDLVRNVIQELKEKARPKDMGLVLEVPKKLRLLIADQEKIRHCVYNFVDNAIKYSREKTKVHIYLEGNKKGLICRVLDKGVGLDRKDLKNLFQKFYRSPNVMRDFQGTGLGLFVVRQFVEAHKGKVWVKSKGLGKGSEFGFFVPYKPPGYKAEKRHDLPAASSPLPSVSKIETSRGLFPQKEGAILKGLSVLAKETKAVKAS